MNRFGIDRAPAPAPTALRASGKRELFPAVPALESHSQDLTPGVRTIRLRVIELDEDVIGCIESGSAGHVQHAALHLPIEDIVDEFERGLASHRKVDSKITAMRTTGHDQPLDA